VTISDSTFTNNSSGGDGGVVDTSDGGVTVSRSTFSGNSAEGDGDGGVIGTSGGAVSVTNSTFTNNTAGDQGAAISVEDAEGSASVNFVTMVGNTSSRIQGPVGAVDSDGDATVTNSIIYGNTGGDVRAGGSLSASYSLFTSTSSVSPTVSGATLIFGDDPLLGSLADNGGPTQTMMPAADSPVIGTANPDTDLTTDQRGFSRTTDGLADMGAVQVGGVAPEPDLSQCRRRGFRRRAVSSGRLRVRRGWRRVGRSGRMRAPVGGHVSTPRGGT